MDKIHYIYNTESDMVSKIYLAYNLQRHSPTSIPPFFAVTMFIWCYRTCGPWVEKKWRIVSTFQYFWQVEFHICKCRLICQASWTQSECEILLCIYATLCLGGFNNKGKHICEQVVLNIPCCRARSTCQV